jgi:flagellar hook-associated protein 2
VKKELAMTGMTVDGLVSGLDTTSIISQLMTAEAAPQTQLKNSLTQAQAAQNAYRSVNTRFAALGTAAAALADPATWSAPSATVSTASGAASGVTAASTATAVVGALSFDVTSTANAHSVATGPFTDISELSQTWPVMLTGTKGGMAFSITAADNTVSGVVAAINNATGINGASLGLTASVVQISPGKFRLQISAKDTGAAGQFTLDGFGPTTVVRTGTDATIDLGGGLVVSSATNTFSDLLPGTTITVTRPTVGVTVAAAVSPDALADKISAMVNAANAALTEARTQSAYNTTTKTGGPLVGDSTVRDLTSRTIDVVTTAIAGGSPTDAGLAVDRSGTITFDRGAFLALMAADPAKAQALAGGVAGALSGVADGATDSTSGSLTLAVQGRASAITELTNRIADWDTRLAGRQAALQQQFSAMETALSSLKNQSSWLAGQISSLSSSA